VLIDARAALPLKQWREGTINPSTGLLHSNYKRLVWGALGYTAYWTRGLFGIVYEPDGLRFKPCVPNDFGDGFRAVLSHVNYRRSRLSITLVGRGTKLQQVLLDGKPVQKIPGDLNGRHGVEIRLAGAVR
jgi:cellobiose phosphorylase